LSGHRAALREKGGVVGEEGLHRLKNLFVNKGDTKREEEASKTIPPSDLSKKRNTKKWEGREGGRGAGRRQRRGKRYKNQCNKGLPLPPKKTEGNTQVLNNEQGAKTKKGGPTSHKRD